MSTRTAGSDDHVRSAQIGKDKYTDSHRAVSFWEIRLLIPQRARQDATALTRLQMLDQSEP